MAKWNWLARMSVVPLCTAINGALFFVVPSVNVGRFELNDPVRPDLAGEYRSFTKLVVDRPKAQGRHIFRIARHSASLVFSEEVKRRLYRVGVTGIYYELVSQ